MKKFVVYVFVFLILAMPVFAFAQINLDLVPCGTSRSGTSESCEFKHLIDLINNSIAFILKFLVIPIAAIMFAYAGFLMVTSGGSTESKTRAKNIFFNAVLGLVFAAGAWIIIKTILTILGYEGGWIGF